MENLEEKYLGKLGCAVCTDGNIYKGRADSEKSIEEFVFVSYHIETPWSYKRRMAIFKKEKDGSLKRIRSEERDPYHIEVIKEGDKKKIRMDRKIIDPEEKEELGGFF